VLHAVLSLAIFLASALVRSEVSDCLGLSALISGGGDGDDDDSLLPSLVVNSLPLAVGFAASALYLAVPGAARRSVDRPLLERLADASDSVLDAA
jgi:hypothetical protein